ncbi:MAG TPA: hypothetical protein VEG30_14345 [Terriglobales bacterium]|nr:hypothetical protein [Terriglobales bacterium]
MRAAITMLGLVLSVSPAFAQGCAMCYASAKHADHRSQNALSRAVAVMLFPTLGLMGGMVGLAMVYGRRRDESRNGDL